MKELQGAIIIGSVFQAFLGYSGLMSILVRYMVFYKRVTWFSLFTSQLLTISILFLLLFRLINPVVVSPTIAAVGLSFYSYGFPQLGTCIEIGVVQILLVIMFSLVSLLAEFHYLHRKSLLFVTFEWKSEGSYHPKNGAYKWLNILICLNIFLILLQYLRKISIMGHRVFLIYAVILYPYAYIFWFECQLLAKVF